MEKNLIKTSCGIPVGKAVLLHGEPAIEVKHGRCKDTLLLKDLLAQCERSLHRCRGPGRGYPCRPPTETQGQKTIKER